MRFEPCGLATGIGSVPLTDPAEAVALIKKYLPDIPHWPQMPARGRQEHFVNQFLGPLIKTGLLTAGNDRVYFDTSQPDWPDKLADFYSIYLACGSGETEALAEFAFPPDSAAGFYAFIRELESKGPGQARYLKGHVVGPLSVALQIKDQGGRLSYYDDQLRDLVVKTIAMHAAWQAAELGRFGPPVLVFVDDPPISVYGQPAYITITREMIKSDLHEISTAIHGAGAMAGVHSCDAIDWSILFESELEVVSFDAYNYFSSLIPYASPLKDFFARGGSLAWGVVPTLYDQALDEDEESLLKIIFGEWSEFTSRGINEDLLARRCLLTPACGTGLLSPGVAEKIYQLTAGTAKKFRELKGL